MEKVKLGFCKECNKDVRLKYDGSCQFGHPASNIIEARPKKECPTSDETRFVNIFSKNNFVVGWSIWWPAFILVSGIVAIRNRTTSVLEPVPDPIPVILCILILNWIGKFVASTKYGLKIQRFIGWSIFWRGILLQGLFWSPPLILALVLEMLKPYEFVYDSISPVLLLYLIPLMIIVLIAPFFSLGWAANRVIHLSAYRLKEDYLMGEAKLNNS